MKSQKTSAINPARFIPSTLTEEIIKPEYGIEVYFSTEQKVAIGYSGKSKKHDFYYRYTTVEQMMGKINSWIDTITVNMDRRAAERAERKAQTAAMSAADHFKVGDFVVNSWGYEQTNIEFYIVTAVKGKTIEIAEVYQEQVEGSMYSHGMACEVVPSTNIIPNGAKYKLRVKAGYRGEVSLSYPKSFYYMKKWNGRPEYKSWYY